jgi:hypothetical protein
MEQIEDRISGFEDKIDLKKQQKNFEIKDSRAPKGTCKNCATTSKEQTCES